MAKEEKLPSLPWELIEEILSRVDPKSLVRLRTVSKQCNTLFNDKKFINNHKNTFRFILATKSKIYSVSINPKIELQDLTLDIPGLESNTSLNLIECNGFLLLEMVKGTVIWNPWLRQARLIEPEVIQHSLQINGIGYDHDGDDNERLEGFGYKALVSYQTESDPNKTIWKTHDFDSNTWKDHEVKSCGGGNSSNNTQEAVHVTIPKTSVSLDGTLYWVASYKTSHFSVIGYFDFCLEKFFKYCDVPCFHNHHDDAIVLRVYREDRFSLFKQCHLTKKIEIWVTKNKIHKRNGKNLEWMNFMEVTIPNLPDLGQTGSYSKPSYFIDGKRLVVCSCDETGRAWIYVLENNKLISKTKIDVVVDLWPLHCTHFPSLVSVPRGKRKEEEI